VIILDEQDANRVALLTDADSACVELVNETVVGKFSDSADVPGSALEVIRDLMPE